MSAFKCPHCGGNISFDPTKEAMKCEYCDSVLTLAEYNSANRHSGKIALNEMVCSQCGAKITSTDETVATFCSYCGSSVVLESRIVEEDAPTAIIPFRVSKNMATGIYSKKIEDTLLAPDWMREEDRISKFRGIYMPFHVFRFAKEGTWQGKGTTFHMERHKHTDYDVTRTYNVSAPYSIDYDFITVDASSAFPDGISRAVTPFRKEKEVGFDPSYYAGFYADRSDVDANVYIDKYRKEVNKDLLSTGTLRCADMNVSAVDVLRNTELGGTSRKSMFPVWFLSFRKKDKVSYAAVNGDTGELAVDIPIDFGRYLSVSIVIAAVLSLIFNIFFTIKPNELVGIVSIISVIAYMVCSSLLNETYARIRHQDDAGYKGVQEKHEPKLVLELIKAVARFAIHLVLVLSAVVFALLLEWDPFIAVLLGFFFLVYDIIRSIVRLVKYKEIEQSMVPFFQKIRVLAKPVIALFVCYVAVTFYKINDLYCYVSCFIGIIMLVLAAFDTVRLHNRFTMRDLPIFNEKRGGDR